MRKQFIALLILLLFLGGMAGNLAALEKVSLQLKWKHQFQFAGYYAAVKEGYYRDVGLEVELIERTPSKTPFDSVLEGDADYGVAGSEIVSEWLAGKPISVLAVIFQHSPVILITRAESGLTNPQQLVGKKAMLGIMRPSADVEAMLVKEGVPLDKLNLLRLSFDITDLIKGNVDVMSVYSTDQPFYLDKLGVNYNIINPTTYGFDFYGDILFTSLQEIKRHPQRVKKFREASLKGWQYALSHVDEMVETIYDQYNTEKRDLSKEYLRFEAEATRKLIMPDMIELGHVNPNRWEKIAQTYVDLGLVEPDYSLDGFIYDPDPEFDPTWLYWVIIIVTSAVAILLLILGVLIKFNRRLQLGITERKKSEEKYRNLFENMIDETHFWELVRDNYGEIKTWRLVDINPTALKSWNKTRAEVVGKTADEIWPESNATEQFMPIVKKIVNEGKPHTWETYFSGTNQTLLMTSVAFGDFFFSTGTDITERKMHQAHLEKIAWLLEQEEFGNAHPRPTTYGNVTELNTERTIRDNVGLEILRQMSSDVMALLDTSFAVYERNGDYAFGSFVSEWCSLMDGTSRELCNTVDNREALDCGRWLCHENCWNDSARAAMESGETTDISCVGGIRLYGVPIYANNEIIGAINMGYGTPPTDEQTLAELAHTFNCDVVDLRKASLAFKARPPFLIKVAKKRLQSLALQIGKTVEASRYAMLLKDSERRNRALLDYSPACHKIIDLDSNLQFMNVTGFKMLKLEVTDKFYGKPYPFDFFPETHRQKLTEGLKNVRETGKHVVLEGATCDSEENAVWLYHNLIPVPGNDGTLDYITVVSSDITDRKQAEEQIKASLKEKETLLDEIHHRVKNNMQVIASLLKLQLLKKDKKDVDAILRENMGRVYSMAAIHESLHQSEKLSDIDFKFYLQKLSHMLYQTYTVDPGKVTFQIDTPELTLAIETANPLGLVLNELISNSLKYAFPDDDKGTITIKSSFLDEETVELIVADDGIGLPDGFDWKTTDTLGLKLVQSLVEDQLDGSIELDTSNRTQFTIKFNLKSKYT